MATLDSQTCQLLNDDFDLDLEPEVYPPALPRGATLPAFGGHPRSREEHPDSRRSPNLWDPRLAIDLATGLDSLPDILTAHGLTQEEFDKLQSVPAFRRELVVAMREVRENGLAFPIKCRTQAEMYLERLDQLVYDPATPASTILSIVTWMAKMAGLEPKEAKDGNQNNTQINVQISF